MNTMLERTTVVADVTPVTEAQSDERLLLSASQEKIARVKGGTLGSRAWQFSGSID